MRVGFIGLGDQGGPMAEMVLSAGFDLAVWARRVEVGVSFAARGAVVAASPAELAARSDLLCLCVTGDADVRGLLLDGGALAAMEVGSIVAVHSTIRPALCVQLAATAAAQGVMLIDAPVSGSGHAARSRSLLVMTGGDEVAVERAQPAFAAFAGTQIHMGPVGAAMNAKLVNNLLAAVHIGDASRALQWGVALEVAPRLLRQAVLAGTGRSFAMEAIERFREPARAAHVRRILGKDVALALDVIPQGEAGRWRALAEEGLDALQSMAAGAAAW